MNDFIKAVTSATSADTVTATFTDGSTAEYTTAIIELLKADKTVENIIDNSTGEVLYIRA